MPSAVVVMQWECYQGFKNTPALFGDHELTFNSRQPRLHNLQSGDDLWLVSRCPSDQQYYFVAVLRVRELGRNSSDSELARRFGEFSLRADRQQSHNLDRRFPAEGLLRAIEFENAKPIKYGANLGQSLQTLRFLSDSDARVLSQILSKLLATDTSFLEDQVGLWTKCDLRFAEYFTNDWAARRGPVGFLLYDPPPTLVDGSPVFVHSGKNLYFVSRLRQSQIVAGHKYTVDADERIAERERIWQAYRAGTINPETRSDFEKFWEGQNGVRGVIVLDELHTVQQTCPFKVYGRALQWGYPIGVGYRYLNLSQSLLLLKITGVPTTIGDRFINTIL